MTLALSDRYAPDLARVTAEVIDGEAIVVDLAKGVYYTMDGVAATIWELIARERTVGEIVETLSHQYIVSTERVVEDLGPLLDSLVTDGLITTASSVGEYPAVEVEPGRSERLPYATPEVRTYGDLSDLLALDLPVPAVTPWLERQPITTR